MGIPSSASPPAPSVTVIVPAYGDYDMTRACLDSLRDALASSNHRAIIIDDASPDAGITDYLKEIAGHDRFELIVNPHNLGFAGSINAALLRITQGDVIILNSDTIVPSGFIDRLAAAAKSSPDIGTVTPLSNNGEFLSFPRPNTHNPSVPRREVERIDAIAARVNARSVADIPSGIGFCLYITRACLERVGALSLDFGRGYLEDADFCLRAAGQGFRNVCAPSVYVGHAGSRSFGREKRSLVVRNLQLLEHRFPNHRRECAAFMAADPLRTARQAIEREAAHTPGHAILMVIGSPVLSETAAERADKASAGGQAVLIAKVTRHANATTLALRHAAGEMPHSLEYDLSSPADFQSLVHFLRAIEPRQIELLDPRNTPFPLVDLLLSLKIPYALFVADAGLLESGDAGVSIRGNDSTLSEDVLARARCGDIAVGSAWTRRWQQIAEGANRIIVPCRQAEAFAIRALSPGIVEKLDRLYGAGSRRASSRNNATQVQLGVVPVRSCVHEQRLIIDLVRQLDKARPPVSVTVLGATHDDIALMHECGAFVTGRIAADEFNRLLADLAITHLCVGATQPIFAHPSLSAVSASGLPVAYLDWSDGRVAPEADDLALDAHESVEGLAVALESWMSGASDGRPSVDNRELALRASRHQEDRAVG
jgi:GT2 family glycosyltransferase